MRKTIIAVVILLLILAGAVLYLYFNAQDITGEVVLDSYSYTTAICNETNYCQDYEIVCRNSELVDKNPITGAAVQHSSNWKDPREEKPLC